jgi:tetratricopeptide (TPR) repeat protein
VEVPPPLLEELAALAHPPTEATWADTLGRLAAVDDGLRHAASAQIERARAQAVDLARWAGATPARLTELERSLPDPAEAVRDDRIGEALASIRTVITERFPEIAERRQRTRELAGRLRAVAEELGASTQPIDLALASDAEATPDAWPASVARLEGAARELGDGLRGRATQALEGLRASLGQLADYGVDPAPARATVDVALARLPAAAPEEIASVLTEARSAAEEPIVTVVAGLLDEVRPRIASARKLGRDPREVFAAMNRAREALRLKIYSEALAASQEALEKVRGLTADLDASRDELATLDEMVGRFRSVGFASPNVDAALARVRQHLARAEIDPARDALRAAFRDLGTGAVGFFVERWKALDRARAFARERGFLPGEADRELAEARTLLDRGDLAAAADGLARAEVALRAAAAPFVARRVEEMEAAFADLEDPSLATPVRRELADADVTLRVKEDLVGAIESLRRAERDFGGVFATHASGLVEALEKEVQVLASMGGAGEEIQHQIDEVQQIFNMGDFVRAAKASQEIRTRTQQQQLVRAEEAVSHAKLGLVELEAMGLDLGGMRAELEGAQHLARNGQFLDAWRRASRLEEEAVRRRGAAQGLVGRLGRVEAFSTRLRGEGIEPGPVDTSIAEARAAVRALEFDRARGILEGVEQRLGAAEAHLESERRLRELGLLLEDGQRLAVPMEAYAARLERLRTEAATAPPEATRDGVRQLHDELVALVRPLLEENLKTLERDLEIAKSAGVLFEPVVTKVAEARRRIALDVPTGAAGLLDEIRAAIVSTRGFVDQAGRVARRVREALGQAELLHVDVATVRARAEEVERALEAREYPRVIELGGTVERELTQATYQHVSKTLAGFQATVTRLRRAGGNASVAENLLYQARMALDEGRPVEALQLASRSESELERADLQQRLAQGAFEAAGRAVERATREGVVSTEVSDQLRSVEGALSRSDYAAVFEQAFAISEAIADARDDHRRARDALANADRHVAEATALGADVREATEHLAEGRAEAAAGHYVVAVQLAHETAEQARWAIERMFSVPLGELRREVEAVRAEGVGAEVEPLDAVVADAEAALRAGSWARVRTSLARADAASRRLFSALVDARWREVDAEAARRGADSPAELARRNELRGQLDRLKERRDLGGALHLLQGELENVRAREREDVAKAMADFRDRLWVGERLGVDTTPVMQRFGEARIALDGGHPTEARTLLDRAGEALIETVRTALARRRKELASEVAFAEGGLHVSVGAVKDRLKEADELTAVGRLLDAARVVLKAEEDLSLRKSLHRELTNLHYLLDAALARANERGVDTTEARALLADSLQLRATDYAAALEKAREALRRLQQQGVVVSEPGAVIPGAAWPFRQPPRQGGESSRGA